MVHLVYEHWFLRNGKPHHYLIEDRKYEREEAFRMLETLYSTTSTSKFYDQVDRTDNAYIAFKFNKEGRVEYVQQVIIK